LQDSSLSSSAHNVKIITRGNTITLRGPAATAAEKERIDALARQFAAGKQVRNALTLKSA
jgi:hyperosmotically inducible protein